MNPWFDYGFGHPLAIPASGVFPQGGVYQATPFTPQPAAVAPVTYPQQPAPVNGVYARQPFVTPSLGGFGYGPYSVSPFGPAFQVLSPAGFPAALQFFPGSAEVIGQSAALQPSPLGRPIGFQPSIGSAGSLPQFQHALSRLPTDDEIEDLISEALDADPFLSSNAEVEVRCENGQITLTGNVQHKRIKHAIGELAWSIPGIVDVQNNLELASRRRIRAGLRKEGAQASGAPRK